MNKGTKYTLLTVVLVGTTILGFNMSESQKNTVEKIDHRIDVNTSVIENMISNLYPSKFKEGLIFSIDGYNQITEEIGNEEQEYPYSWIKDIEEGRTSSWARVYHQSITKASLGSSKVVGDLIDGYPLEWLKDYKYISVSIKSMIDKKYRSFMNKSPLISADQRSILNDVTINDKVEIVINYQRINYTTGEEEFDQLNMVLKIVPEVEAKFTLGYDSLIQYFNENNEEKIKQLTFDQYVFMRLQFTITEEGLADEIKIDRKSGNEEMDRHIISLLENMPKWEAARNGRGEAVRQQFELFFGKPGC